MKKPIGRPKKARNISQFPKTVQFSPRGRPGRPEEVELDIDEVEALYLSDWQGLDQVRAAGKMAVSRPTFGRILKKARRKTADALVNGKIIRIAEGFGHSEDGKT